MRKKLSVIVFVVVALVALPLLFFHFKFQISKEDYAESRGSVLHYKDFKEVEPIRVSSLGTLDNFLFWEVNSAIDEYNSASDKNSQLAHELEDELRLELTELESRHVQYSVVAGKLDLDFVEIESTDKSGMELWREKNIYVENLNEQLVNAQNKLKDGGEFSNALWLATDNDLEELVAGMDISEKAGQLLMIIAQGQDLSSAYEQRLKKVRPGGVILMGGNVSDIPRTAAFSKDIQTTNKEIPLFVATDQEGGVVKRVPWDTTPGQSLWDSKSEAEVCEIGKKRSRVLKDIGVNVNFAPVVDIQHPDPDAFINHRTISSDPSKVSKLSEQFVKCSQAEDVYATLKHFPGHGSTIEDSHYVLPQINKSKDDWLKTDAVPYKEINEAGMVMVGHLKFKQIDSDNPASQSKILLTDVLRGELGYEGIIITDAMGQLHGSTGISVKDALKGSINAGVDIVLYVSTPTSEENIHTELIKLIESGEISEERVDESVTRILRAKRNIY